MKAYSETRDVESCCVLAVEVIFVILLFEIRIHSVHNADEFASCEQLRYIKDDDDNDKGMTINR